MNRESAPLIVCSDIASSTTMWKSSLCDLSTQVHALLIMLYFRQHSYLS